MRLDEMGYAELIRENIELDTLLVDFPHDKDFIMGIYDLIHETVLCKSETIVVASNRYSTNFVRGKLLKLDKFHIEYVIDCWHKNTADAYITAEVNHDMASPGWGMANC